MNHTDHSHIDAHSQDKDCGCNHDHQHGSTHDSLSPAVRWLLSILIVSGVLIVLRPFIVGQMIVRETSYSASSLYDDALRICKRIILIDPNNKQAWTSLGYAFMDLSQTDQAIAAFNEVLLLNPNDKAAASFELGQAFYGKGDFSKAIFYFERIRTAGPRAGAILDADILKYRHGTLGFRSLNSMQSLLGALLDCYQKTGNISKMEELQKEYDFYKKKHNKVLF